MAKVITLALATILTVIPMTLAAKNLTSPDSSNNDKAVAGVAGPAAATNTSHPNKSAKRSGKKASQKTHVTLPPPMHDPN